MVSAELDLRARRDPEVAAALAGHERGWRELLVGLLGRSADPRRRGRAGDRHRQGGAAGPRARRAGVRPARGPGHRHRGGTAMNVIIVGGGIGGLTLAQGLRRAGVPVAVYERDTGPGQRWDGYRIHINPVGARALRACLPGTGLERVPGHRRAGRRLRFPHRGARRAGRRRRVDHVPGRCGPGAQPPCGRPDHAAAHPDHRAGRHPALRRRVRRSPPAARRAGAGVVRRRAHRRG